MARQWMTPFGFVIDEDGEEEWMTPFGVVINEDQAATLPSPATKPVGKLINNVGQLMTR